MRSAPPRRLELHAAAAQPMPGWDALAGAGRNIQAGAVRSMGPDQPPGLEADAAG